MDSTGNTENDQTGDKGESGILPDVPFWKVIMAVFAGIGYFLDGFAAFAVTPAEAAGRGLGAALFVWLFLVVISRIWRGAEVEWGLRLPINSQLYHWLCIVSGGFGAIGGLFGYPGGAFFYTYVILVGGATAVRLFRAGGKSSEEDQNRHTGVEVEKGHEA